MEILTEKINKADSLRLEGQKSKEKVVSLKCAHDRSIASLKQHETYLVKVSSRLKELESGKGRDLCCIKDTHVYEFWIETPSYSGPIRGTSATLRQIGDIQHIPITKGKSKGGYFGATIGANVAGPTGAAVGGILGRKNEVETTIKTVDNRKFHVDIKGNGWAWSLTLGSEYAQKSEALRDLINIVGSSNDDINGLLLEQRQEHERAINTKKQLVKDVDEADSNLNNAKGEFNRIKKDYVNHRVPFWEDVKYRWSQTSSTKRFLLYVIGPVPVGVCLVSPLAVLSGHLTKSGAQYVVLFGVIYAALLGYIYLSKVRLI